MTDITGNNASGDIRARATRMRDVLDRIAELQEEVKAIKADAKSDGYDVKALGAIVRELRRGPKYQAAQLQLELVQDTYRRAVDLPVTLEAAQAALLADSESLPDDITDVTDHDNDGRAGPRSRRNARAKGMH